MHDAIMIGVGTALGDDPLLTVRQSGLDQKALRVVLDSGLSLPPESRLCATAETYPTLVITTAAASAEREAALRARGVEVERVGGEQVDLGEALRLLGRRGITRVFSEGGPTVGAALIREGLADEVLLFTAREAARPTGPPGAWRPTPSRRSTTSAAMSRGRARPMAPIICGAGSGAARDRARRPVPAAGAGDGAGRRLPARRARRAGDARPAEDADGGRGRHRL